MKVVSAAEVARDFVIHWVFDYGPAIHLLDENGGAFTSQLFQNVLQSDEHPQHFYRDISPTGQLKIGKI